MNRPDFRHALPATALAAGGCATSGQVRLLRVISYNLNPGEGTDGRVDLERSARVIRDSRADLVALQEIDVNT
jgi:endonuclease/exonuclease/phosphatase family metal-dependent hydrolase